MRDLVKHKDDIDVQQQISSHQQQQERTSRILLNRCGNIGEDRHLKENQQDIKHALMPPDGFSLAPPEQNAQKTHQNDHNDPVPDVVLEIHGIRTQHCDNGDTAKRRYQQDTKGVGSHRCRQKSPQIEHQQRIRPLIQNPEQEQHHQAKGNEVQRWNPQIANQHLPRHDCSRQHEPQHTAFLPELVPCGQEKHEKNRAQQCRHTFQRKFYHRPSPHLK
ncbi:hypothetical protein [Ruminococcus sp.]|uniref:hypothetical protein n=1 Tax=Ruminococcus sp. TaxID=41978 RepID=UPI00300E7AB1